MLFYLDDKFFFKVAFTAITFLVLAPLIVWGNGIDGKGLMCERPNEYSPYGTQFKSIFFAVGKAKEAYPEVANDQYFFTFYWEGATGYKTTPNFITWREASLDRKTLELKLRESTYSCLLYANEAALDNAGERLLEVLQQDYDEKSAGNKI